MTTITAHHLLLTTNWVCTTGPFLGEQSSWTLRFAVNGPGEGPNPTNRPSLDAGQFNLNSFDCHTDVKTRAVTVSSIAGSLSQTWQGDASPDTEQVTENDIDFFITKAVDLCTAVRTMIPTSWKLEVVKLYAVDAQGHAKLGPNAWTPTATFAGTGSGNALSPEVAMCVSLYTAHRAKAGRGRTYIGPLTQGMLQADGLFTSAAQTAARGGMKALQDSVRTRGTPGASACYVGIIWNRTPGTTGCVINKIRTGDEPDVQERRTKSRPEIFTDSNVV